MTIAKTLLGLVVGTSIIGLADVAVALESVPVSGHTSANRLLLADTVNAIHRVARNRLKCNSFEALDIKFLGKPSVVPRSFRDSQDGQDALYEIWSATLCSRKRDFLVVFRPSKIGGTTYRIKGPLPRGQ